MRKSKILDALLPKTMQGILAATCLSSDRWWYLSDLAKHLHLTPSSLQRPLTHLVSGGILKRRAEGNRVYFQIESSSPIFSELQSIILKTIGLADVLTDFFEPFRKNIRFLFVYGSMAKSSENSSSDIDLFLIGGVKMSEISSALREAEKKVGRPVSLKIQTVQGFKNKLNTKNHFTNALVESHKLFVIGDENELEKIIGRKSRGTP